MLLDRVRLSAIRAAINIEAAGQRFLHWSLASTGPSNHFPYLQLIMDRHFLNLRSFTWLEEAIVLMRIIIVEIDLMLFSKC